MILSVKIRTLLFPAVAYSLFAVAFSACSGSDEPIPESKPVEIIVSTGFGSTSGVETRVTGSISKENILSDGPVPLSVVRIDQTSETDASYLPYTQTNGNDKGQAPRNGFLEELDLNINMRFDPEENYLSRAQNNNTKLMGWYPQVDDTDGSFWSVNGGAATVSFTVDGKTDILMSNLVEGNINNPFNSENNTLTFKHLLTRFYVRVFTRSALIANEWGDVQSVRVKGKAQSCVVQLPGMEAASNTFPSQISFTGNSDLPIIYNDPNNTTPVPVISGEVDDDSFLIGTTLVGYVMVAPETNKMTLEVVNENGSGIINITAPQDGFQAGKSYTLSLEYTMTEILISGVTISEWIDGEGQEVTIN